MKVRVTESGEEMEAIIEPLEDKDFKLVAKTKGQFGFNWKKYKGKEIFKLRASQNEQVLGLLCLVDHTDPSVDAIEIELLEVGKDNVGKNKQIENIAGCLIAFACRESIKRGHEGFMFLTPKTGLIEHYAQAYQFLYFPPLGFKPEGIMVSTPANSIALIAKYLEPG